MAIQYLPRQLAQCIRRQREGDTRTPNIQRHRTAGQRVRRLRERENHLALSDTQQRHRTSAQQLRGQRERDTQPLHISLSHKSGQYRWLYSHYHLRIRLQLLYDIH
jgi:hypothetical protein